MKCVDSLIAKAAITLQPWNCTSYAVELMVNKSTILSKDPQSTNILQPFTATKVRTLWKRNVSSNV